MPDLWQVPEWVLAVGVGCNWLHDTPAALLQDSEVVEAVAELLKRKEQVALMLKKVKAAAR